MTSHPRRLLYVSTYFPSESFPAAGQRACGLLLDEKSREFDVVDLVAFQTEYELSTKATISERKNINTFLFRIKKADRIVSAFLFPFLPNGAAVRVYLGRRRLRKLFEDNVYDEIFVDGTQALPVLPRKYWSRAVMRAHDVLVQLYSRATPKMSWETRFVYAVELRRWKRVERMIAKRVGEILTFCDKDKKLFETLGRHSGITITPPNALYEVAGRSDETIDGASIIFWGNMSRKENTDAALYFARELFPSVRGTLPDLRFVVVGANPPSDLELALGEGAVVTGRVDSPEPYFLQGVLGVVPLRTGAGIKFKTLEMLLAGMPVVSTSIGAEGVPDHPNLIVVDEPDLFIRNCIEIILRERKRLHKPGLAS